MKINCLTRFLDIIAPRRCAVCGYRLCATEELLCSVCLLHIPRTMHCFSPKDNPMIQMFWGKLNVEKAAAFYYHLPHSLMANIIYGMKYRGYKDWALEIGRVAAREMNTSGFFDEIDLIVPLPLNRRREYARGYNQSVMLARGVNLITKIPVEEKAIKRVHYNDAQVNINGRIQRQENVAGAFRVVKPDKLRGHHLLIIDDVVTTGATLEEVGREVSKLNDVKLSFMTLAMTYS